MRTLALLALVLVGLASPALAHGAHYTAEAAILNAPVKEGQPVEVAARVSGNPELVVLAACEWDTVKQNATYCQLPVAMTKGEDGLWRGTSNEGFPGGVTAGYKLLVSYPDGTNFSWPGTPEYKLFTVEATPRNTPASGLVPVLAVVAAAALVVARRR
ncbi:MAG TPA: hypothetical protein VNZ52_07140 [Candidatus Thermoplasmatota archaeon]|nr:hypothetical protein [Candidatus Thermoplasmatota archaeon]